MHLCFCLSSGPLVYFLQQVDRALSRASPFAAVGVVVGTVYWSAVTYGAVTVMQVQWASNMLHRKSVKPANVTVSSSFSSYYVHVQVVGHKKGLYVMERADPLFLLMGLPTIPVVLVLGKMIRWEDYIVRLWQRYCYKGTLPPGMNTHTHIHVGMLDPVLLQTVAYLIQANIHLSGPLKAVSWLIWKVAHKAKWLTFVVVFSFYTWHLGVTDVNIRSRKSWTNKSMMMCTRCPWGITVRNLKLKSLSGVRCVVDTM